MKFLLSLLLITVVANSFFVEAKSAYVYDKDRKIRTRTGPGDDFKLADRGGYPAGTKFEVINTPAENGYSQVMDKSGHKSWTRSNNLLPAASVLLDKAKLENKVQKASHQEAIAQLRSELQARAPLEKINRNLQSKISKMQIELEQLRQADSARNSRFNREWFFSGGTTVIVGILIGWIFGLKGRKRNSAWN